MYTLNGRVDEDEADLSYGQEFSSKEQEAFSREQEASFSKEPARKKLSSKKISRDAKLKLKSTYIFCIYIFLLPFQLFRF